MREHIWTLIHNTTSKLSAHKSIISWRLFFGWKVVALVVFQRPKIEIKNKLQQSKISHIKKKKTTTTSKCKNKLGFVFSTIIIFSIAKQLENKKKKQ